MQLIFYCNTYKFFINSIIYLFESFSEIDHFVKYQSKNIPTINKQYYKSIIKCLMLLFCI